MGMGMGMGVQAVWFCTPPQRIRDWPQQAWSQCFCLVGAQQKMLHTQNSAEVWHYIIHTKQDEILHLLYTRKQEKTVLTKDPVTFSRALSFVLSLSCHMLVSVRLGTDKSHTGPPHSQGYSLPQLKLLLKRTEVPELSVYLCTEGNKTQEDFSEHYKFPVEVDPTSPGVRASHGCWHVTDAYEHLLSSFEEIGLMPTSRPLQRLISLSQG